MATRIDTPYGEALVQLGQYSNGALAVQLVAGDGEPIGKLSVNLPEHTQELAEGEFFAKTWSENECFVTAALASGMFEDTGRRVETGYVEAQVWRITGSTE